MIPTCARSINVNTQSCEPLYVAVSDETVTLTVEENTNATVILQDNFSSDVKNAAIQVVLHQNASLRLYFCLAQAIMDRLTIELNLQGAGAHAQIRGIVALYDHESITIKTVQKHTVPNTQSQVLVKALLSDYAQCRYEGLISVDKTAHNTHAAQQNKNIVLSDYARAYARPSLEVETNEVKCSHGSATGPLDKNQLLYLISRGVAKKQAEHLLIRAFIADVLRELPLALQEEMLQTILDKIERDE